MAVHGYCVCVCVSRPKIKLRFRGIALPALEFNFYPGLKQCYRSLEIRIDSRFRGRIFVIRDRTFRRYRFAREIRNATRTIRKFSTISMIYDNTRHVL